MKKLIAIFLSLLFVGCVHVQLKPSDEVITELQKSALSTVGYLVVKNNPEYAPKFEQWYLVFKDSKTLIDVQENYKDGIKKLSQLISDDPFLQLQIENAMNMLEVTGDGPAIPSEIEKYQYVVDSFMVGVSVYMSSR